MLNLLSVDQAAAVLGISRRKLAYLYAAGEIAYIRIDRVIRFEMQELQSFVARHRKNGQTAEAAQ